MDILGNLQPSGVFGFFEQMCAIPHGSGDTKAVSDWCVEFAKQRGLEYYQDSANNVIIKKPASAGYESAAPVIIQGHLDMVCEKEDGCAVDMKKDGLDLFVDGDLVGARGTTLGGDDGIAVAMALAVLDSDSIKHPAIEAVFTTDEETGMNGARELDVSSLKGRLFLNIDSEDEGVLTVSCAGGNVTQIILPAERESSEGSCLCITVKGLTGGHSGAEIHKGRANANILMGRILEALSRACSMRIVSVNGGLKDNAIPTMSSAVVIVSNAESAKKAAAKCESEFKNEYRSTDPNLSVTAEDCSTEDLPMVSKSTSAVINLLMCTPNGVQDMSHDIEGLVQTSVNLGILKTKNRYVEATFCVRSSVDSQKEMIKKRIMCLSEAINGSVYFAGDYPGWEYRKESHLRSVMADVFEKQYGYAPKIEAIHAGLECGLFSGKLEGLDCVSFGPDLFEIHTPRERMSISSVQRTWEYLLAVLAALK